MKPEKASLHAPKVRFMARSAASYILMLDEQSSQAQNVLHTFVCLTRQRRARHKVLHKNAFSDEALFRFTPQYEASSFHSDMKHSAYAPYDLSSIALRATDDEKMENESLSVCNTTLSALYYDLQSSPLWLDFFVSHFYPMNDRYL